MKKNRAYYRFLFNNILRGLLFLAVILATIVLFDKLMPADIKIGIIDKLDRPVLVFAVFFFSETFVGIIPPEYFIIWASTETLGRFCLYVGLLAVISMLGGIIAYQVGLGANKVAFLKRIMQLETVKKYARIYRRWGGVVIVIAALTPVPYATISFLSAALGFPFKRYMLYASTRLLRFLFLGYILWQV